MKIALVNNLYYPYNRGGAETVVKKMVAELKSQGHDLFLITTEPKNKKNLKEKTESDLKIYRLPSNYYRLAEIPVFRRVFWHLGNIFSYHKTAQIKKILKTEKPDLVITHNLMGLGFLLPQAIKKLHIRHEHYLHDIQLLYPSGLMMFGQEKIIDGSSAKIYQLFTRSFFSSPAKIISPSSWLLDQHLKRGFFKESETEIKNLISQGAEEQKITSTSDEKKEKKNLLFVGQIEYHKGILFLLKTFQELLLIKPELKLTIVGAGTLLAEVKKSYAANKNIEFVGALDSSGVKALMQASDCLIIPSLCYENSPATIYEAHAVGLSVFAANIGGIPEIINLKDKLFKPGDANDLKEKIIERATEK